ncbi:MAG: PSD1 and planctomycete cytochrome C domain-containing protein [Planctomycetota bacterium]|nr:PSD1 and planctomycete cytochrome C domain-containing protein [Planctomycetota bacterium]
MPLLSVLLLLPCASLAQEGPAVLDGDALFTGRIAPILEHRCGRCHGPDARRIKGGLSMTGREALIAGGDSGPAVVPGDPDASLLIRAVRYAEPDYEMPPKGRIPADELADLERWVAAGAPWPVETITDTQREALRFFEAEVRPVLAARCYECHGPEVTDPEGGLRFTSAAALLEGGPSGPAIVPGDAEASLLVRALRREDPDLAMPPDDPVSEEEIEAVATWINLGAPWPAGSAALADEGVDIDAGRSWWSFQPLERPPVPAPAGGAATSHPIDAFVDARLAAAGLEPNPPADPRTLVRRITFDLWGLPPTYEEVEAYLADDGPGRWERLIERLLASPRYGERWGRRWLDVVRFAETNGYEMDAPKPYAWRYRDYVIDSLNADKPYDRFLREQLAGDELPGADDEAVIATGFHHLGVWDSEPDDRPQAVFDGYDDVMRTVGEGVMGLTVGCARCHDHKFDPLRQEDYYGLLAFLRDVQPYKPTRFTPDSATVALLEVQAADLERHERLREEHIAELVRRKGALGEVLESERLATLAEDLPAEARAALALPEQRRTREQKRLLGALSEAGTAIRERPADLQDRIRKEAFRIDQEIELARTSFEGALPWALAVRAAKDPPEPMRVLVRGQARRPGRRVAPHFPPVLFPAGDGVPPDPGDGGAPALSEETSRGRRRLLADWLVSPEHPTVARVLVNRLWLGHFGRGIVATPGDFGAQGAPPSHPQLLDWLACEVIDRGWSLKAMHRLILTSQAYRRSSSTANPVARAADPESSLLWRQHLRRLEAEALRDSLLAVSGELSLEMGGRGFFPRISREALASASRPGAGWGLSPLAERNRRAIYGFAKRGLAVPLLDVFDLADPNNPIGDRAVTTVAPQALTLLHSELPNRAAAALARRVMTEEPTDPRARLARLYQRVLSRLPEPDELAAARDYLTAHEDTATPAPLRIEGLVPSRLATEYLAQLSGEDVLHAPREGWSVTRGVWQGEYNATLGVDPERGPAAFLDEPSFADGRVTARLLLEEGTERAGLILRGEPFRNAFAGIELVLDPTAAEVRLVEHAPLVGPRVLAAAPANIEAELPLSVVLEVTGARVRARLDDLLDAPLEATTTRTRAGLCGLRAWGAGLVVEHGSLEPAGSRPLALEPDPGPEPALAALESLCLVLLNLNEFAYVD